MINLARLRYARATADAGGPIRLVEVGAISVMGCRVYQASAYLNDSLGMRRTPGASLGHPDGTGTNVSPDVARYVAVSEALERWCYQVVNASPDREKYGYGVDGSTNGMAAFPGLFARQARTPAFREAAERIALLRWWEGLGAARRFITDWPDVDGWELDNTVSAHRVVLVHACVSPGWHAYATAAGKTLLEAQQRASVELVRAQYSLKRWLRLRETRSKEVGPAPTLSERRRLFFAAEAGYQVFLQRCARAKAPGAPRPACVFDGEIPGPWSRYATVWRVVFQPPSDGFLKHGDDYFFW